MPTISSTGVGSGLPLKELIQNLMEAESKPKVEALDKKEINSLLKITAYARIKASLNDFQTATQALQSTQGLGLHTVVPTTVTVNNVNYLTTTADTTALPASYQISVVALAQSQTMSSTNFPTATSTVGSGTLSFTVGAPGDQEIHSLVIPDDANDLTSICNAINAQSNSLGVSATILCIDPNNYQLVISASNPGTNGAFSIAAVNGDIGNLSDLDTANLNTLVVAQNSQLQIDNQIVTRQSNVINDIITGVTFNLLQTDPVTTPVTTHNITIANDINTVSTLVQNFVHKYNAFMDVVNEASKIDPNLKNRIRMEQLLGKDAAKEATGHQGTSENPASGILLGDVNLMTMLSTMRNAMTGVVDNPGSFTSLAQMGIIPNGITGKLKIELGSTTDGMGILLSANTLMSALNSDFDGVASFFGGSLANNISGFANNVYEAVDSIVATNVGYVDTVNVGLMEKIKDVGQQRLDLERRMMTLQQNLNRRFTALDVLVARLKNKSEFVMEALNNTPWAHNHNRREH